MFRYGRTKCCDQLINAYGKHQLHGSAWHNCCPPFIVSIQRQRMYPIVCLVVMLSKSGSFRSNHIYFIRMTMKPCSRVEVWMKFYAYIALRCHAEWTWSQRCQGAEFSDLTRHLRFVNAMCFVLKRNTLITSTRLLTACSSSRVQIDGIVQAIAVLFTAHNAWTTFKLMLPCHVALCSGNVIACCFRAGMEYMLMSWRLGASRGSLQAPWCPHQGEYQVTRFNVFVFNNSKPNVYQRDCVYANKC